MTHTMPSPKEQFLQSYDREHVTTMRVLHAYPKDKLDLRPHAKCRTARELAWIFVMERMFASFVFNNGFASGAPGAPPPAPESWTDLLAAVGKGHKDFGDLVRSIPDHKLLEPIKFFTAPKTMGDVPRLEFAWFMLSDEIHHRGQFSIYLRMADGRVPSIYGPSGDEPWM